MPERGASCHGNSESTKNTNPALALGDPREGSLEAHCTNFQGFEPAALDLDTPRRTRPPQPLKPRATAFKEDITTAAPCVAEPGRCKTARLRAADLLAVHVAGGEAEGADEDDDAGAEDPRHQRRADLVDDRGDGRGGAPNFLDRTPVFATTPWRGGARCWRGARFPLALVCAAG